MDIKSIATVYDGNHFRSRLEARWAIVFNELNIQYEYEKTLYKLNQGTIWYLPDFWLPELECFFEVKGKQPTLDECNKAHYLAREEYKNVYIAIGNIRVPNADAEGSLAYIDKKDHEYYRTDDKTIYCCEHNLYDFSAPPISYKWKFITHAFKQCARCNKSFIFNYKCNCTNKYSNGGWEYVSICRAFEKAKYFKF